MSRYVEIADQVLAEMGYRQNDQNDINDKRQSRSLSLDVDALIRDTCAGLAVTPAQFRAVCTPQDIEDIRAGGTPPDALRTFAKSIAEGIASGRIAFHPATGALVRHDVRTAS